MEKLSHMELDAIITDFIKIDNYRSRIGYDKSVLETWYSDTLQAFRGFLYWRAHESSIQHLECPECKCMKRQRVN
jgi:hypothetical protein